MWRKVVGATALVCLLWLVVGGATIYYIHGQYEAHIRDLAGTLTTIRATDAMQDVLWRLQATVMEVAEQADSHTRFEVTELEGAFQRHLREVESDSTAPESRDWVREIREQFSLYRDHIQQRLEARTQSGSQPPAQFELARLAHAVAEPCQHLLEIQEQRIVDATHQRSRLRDSFDVVTLVLWFAGPVLGILCGFAVARNLRRSISDISISLKDAAGGLEHELGRVELHPSDDLSTLHQQVQLVSSRIKQVVEQLQEARRETMLADRLAAVGELAAGVAHELRNPLTAVKLLIQTAAQRPAERPLSEKQLCVVQQQIVRMENTIQGLLDFARPPPMHQVQHDLRDTLRRALNLIEGHAHQQDVLIHEDFAGTPVPVEGDPEQLHQVFVNLLLNGIEALPQGGELWVAIRSEEPAGTGCRITVSDSGPGIPLAIMERMFEPFVTGKERGTGLGLAISRRIVQQHGGQLAAANGASGGAVFTVTLPVPGDDTGRRDRRDGSDA